ncbi:hypothetical protein HK097_004160, partial [Rhizophlyctis rosea]
PHPQASQPAPAQQQQQHAPAAPQQQQAAAVPQPAAEPQTLDPAVAQAISEAVKQAVAAGQLQPVQTEKKEESGAEEKKPVEEKKEEKPAAVAVPAPVAKAEEKKEEQKEEEEKKEEPAPAPAPAPASVQEGQDEGGYKEWNEENWLAEAGRRKERFAKMVQDGEKLPPVSWVLTEGNNIPQGALIGGQEKDGRQLYIERPHQLPLLSTTARAFQDRGIHIGKTASHLDGARIPYGGKEVTKEKYEVLCGFDAAVKWVDGKKQVQLAEGVRAVEAGREEHGAPLYIAQGEYHGSVVPGKCGPQLDAGAMIPYGGDEVTCKKYRYLVYG